jgi:hypothetical protein
MASQSVDFLPDKPYVFLTPRSTNHKEDDIIKAYLHELKIAYKVIAGHPDVLEEYKAALSAAKHSEPRQTEQSNVSISLSST